MATLLTETGEYEVTAHDGLYVPAADAERATGWTLKPEGMCRDDICVPLPGNAVHGQTVDLAALWRKLEAPVLSDDTHTTWVLGTGAAQRNQALAGLAAPEIALPDFAGVPRRLSELRGRKVFLTTWSSW